MSRPCQECEFYERPMFCALVGEGIANTRGCSEFECKGDDDCDECRAAMAEAAADVLTTQDMEAGR